MRDQGGCYWCCGIRPIQEIGSRTRKVFCILVAIFLVGTVSGNHQNCWSYFKAKMHQIRFRLGLRPTARWGGGAYSAPQFKGPTSKGKERCGDVDPGEVVDIAWPDPTFSLPDVTVAASGSTWS